MCTAAREGLTGNPGTGPACQAVRRRSGLITEPQKPGATCSVQLGLLEPPTLPPPDGFQGRTQKSWNPRQFYPQGSWVTKSNPRGPAPELSPRNGLSVRQEAGQFPCPRLARPEECVWLWESLSPCLHPFWLAALATAASSPNRLSQPAWGGCSLWSLRPGLIPSLYSRGGRRECRRWVKDNIACVCWLWSGSVFLAVKWGDSTSLATLL